MKHLVVAVAVLIHFTMADNADLKVSWASNQFASQLYQELAKTPGNVLVCPVSVHIALALVHQGASGATANELGNTLHLSGSNDDIKNSYKALLKGLEDDVLKIATKLYPAISFKPKPDYVSVAQQYFLSDIQPLDFNKATDAANTINQFVESKTNNKIHDIIKSDSLSDLTRLIIVNAVHFKASWAKTFPPAFTDNFKVTPTESVKTKFLGQTDYFAYKEDPLLEAKILKMDYENATYSMVFVLPKKDDGLPELEAKLASTSMDTLLRGLKVVRVEVTIPKFKIEQEMQLKDVLTKMGIVSMFDSRADLKNMAEGENLFVDSVVQKTYIDVNEEGTEAAAATGFITPLSGGSEEDTFIARKPFHFYLIHNSSPQVILFNGRLVKPLETGKTPPKESSQTPLGEPEGGSNLNEETNGDLNRIIGEQQGIMSSNHGSGFITGSSVSHNYVPHPTTQPKPQKVGQNNGYNLNQQPQNFEQNNPINSFNQNRYPVPQTTPSNNWQSSQAFHGYNQYSNYETWQHSQTGFASPQSQQGIAASQPYGVQPTGQPKYSYQAQTANTYLQQGPYQPQDQTYYG